MDKNSFLTKRLSTIVSFLPQGAKVIDVGTDHGYIPAFLAKNGMSSAVFASDINVGPLESAKKHAKEYGVFDQIDFILTDGLAGTKDLDYDTVIIAGMGGEVITGILENAPWLKEERYRLILQPQSKICELANWLDNNGFAISDAKLVKDMGKLYVVMSVAIGKSRAPFSCSEMYVDRILVEKRDPLLGEYLDLLISRFSHVLDGMHKAKQSVGVDEYWHTKLALQGFLKLKEEMEKW